MSFEYLRTDDETLNKTATEKVRREFDFSEDMLQGEVITSIQSVVYDPPGQLSDVTAERVISGTIAGLLLQDGVVGTVYKVTCTVATDNGQILEAAGKILIGEA